MQHPQKGDPGLDSLQAVQELIEQFGIVFEQASSGLSPPALELETRSTIARTKRQQDTFDFQTRAERSTLHP